MKHVQKDLYYFKKLRENIFLFFVKKGCPTTILTDNFAAKIAAIKATCLKEHLFYMSFIYYMPFGDGYIIMTIRFENDDRTPLMIDFKQILKSENFLEVETAYKACLENRVGYLQWIKYVQND